jgi:EAL domain-containing protein (putative c-di-GMP-specific phosphodiesterase class I)
MFVSATHHNSSSIRRAGRFCSQAHDSLARMVAFPTAPARQDGSRAFSVAAVGFPRMEPCIGLRQFYEVNLCKGDLRLRKTSGPSNIGVPQLGATQMPASTSTAPASPHRLVRDTRERLQRLPWRESRGGLDSQAGLAHRPWLARLRRALREESFVLHYQPILSLASGEVDHYEALVRLADEPDSPPLAPAAFLPAAERYGLIREIDRMVIAKAVRLLAEDLESDISLAVNLSALSIVDGEMLAHIECELARHCVAPGRLTIEVTETAAISDMARAVAFCEGAAALGCALALDDFGVGFGSFYYVKCLPFSYLKIDGEFIRGLCASAPDRLMVRALVEVACGMGMRTIAEFVGDGATLELLRELGVDYAQGFHVGRPRSEIGRGPEIRCARIAAPPL